MIRLAKAEDIPQLITLGERAIKETGYPTKLDRKKTKQMLFHAILQQIKNGPIRIWVVDVGESVVGIFIGQIDTLYFSRDKYATDLLFYVLPEHRGNGPLLVKRFLKWVGQHSKVVDITLQQSSGIEVARTDRLYKKLGFKNVGGCYVNYRGQNEQSSQKNSQAS